MNKTTLKNFAISARRELIKKVEAKALKIGISEENIKKAQLESSDVIYIDGKQLSIIEKKQRDKLIYRINELGYKSVMEEAAYTWFNRFTALRFMEVNNYLPTKVRVLSSSHTDGTEPDMMKEALSLDLHIDKELVYELKVNNNSDELFKYLIIKHCNDLNHYMPFMFEKIDDYTEILFPEGLLSKESIVRQMTNIEVIPEDNWEKVEIIGWLYQFYNTEMNELVYDGNMSKSRIPKELLPAATQLFTPEWSVKYMVENSLARLWLECNPNDDLKDNWKYYLDNDDEKHFDKNQNKQFNPEDIKLIDPCMGSGHILVYAFDVLMQIYESCGYNQREATKLILQKNLYGLEIDDRAYQLSCFALMMKARKYNRRILDEKINLNICSIHESNELLNIDIKFINNYLDEKDTRNIDYLISVFEHAKEFGSIINIENREFEDIHISLIDDNIDESYDLFKYASINKIKDVLPKLIKQAQIMSKKYDIVITNPPYLGNARMSPLLSNYVKKYYPNTKSDLSMVIYQKALDSYAKPKGLISFITTNSWMFLKSFNKFRESILKSVQFTSLVDYGTELFDGKVGHNPIVSWVNRNIYGTGRITAIRLVEFCYSKRNQKEREFFNTKNRYYPIQENLTKIPGNPISYWLSEKAIDICGNTNSFEKIATTRAGMITGNNDKFIRLWFEMDFNKVGLRKKSRQEGIDSIKKWFPYNKGGDFRKWYGNNEYVVNWENDGNYMRNFNDDKGKIPAHAFNLDYIFKENITWSSLSSYKFSARYSDYGFLYDASGSFAEVPSKLLKYLLAFLCTKVTFYYLSAFNPTLNFQKGNVSALPTKIDNSYLSTIDEIVQQNVTIAKTDWDSFETSWDFKKHPLLNFREDLIYGSFTKWTEFLGIQFQQLKTNEEKLNQIFINIYDLEEELNCEIDDKDITLTTNLKYRYKVNKKTADEPTDTEIEEYSVKELREKFLKDTIKELISYSIGCMFGRYSIDEEGLIFAGGNFNPRINQTFIVDKENILTILPGEYFENDIVTYFIEFIKTTFSEEKLVDNLEFIAKSIGKKDGETAKETIRRYFINNFFKDHVQTYKKRPVYWLFTSGKQKAFNCLIYMHRYDKSTLSRIRTDYLLEFQTRLDVEKKSLLDIIESDVAVKEISNAKKELKSIDLKIEELKTYDELLHHMADMQIEIDLDDGVAVNYAKFDGLLAKI